MTEKAKELLDKFDHNLNVVLFDLVDENETLEGQVNELREQVARLTRNKGEWISRFDDEKKEGWYECTCCHSERAFNTNFCPDCGARMKGSE